MTDSRNWVVSFYRNVVSRPQKRGNRRSKWTLLSASQISTPCPVLVTDSISPDRDPGPGIPMWSLWLWFPENALVSLLNRVISGHVMSAILPIGG